MTGDTRLVSVIVPVRNGAATLRLVLDGLTGQTHKSIEILISDNASTDTTAEICTAAVSRDHRVRYVRHAEPKTASENFRFWLNEARGQFVIFAAHDDLRSRNYISGLLEAATEIDNVVCVTPSVYFFSSYGADPYCVPQATRMNVFFVTTRAGVVRDAHSLLHSWGGALVYGLIRRDCLSGYCWPDIEFDSDVPLNLYLVLAGRVAHRSSSAFYYFRPVRMKTLAAAAQENNFSSLRPFGLIRMAWACALAAAAASRWRGRPLPASLLFPPLYALLKWPSIKRFLYRISPASLRASWRQWKRRLGLPLN